MTNVSIIIGSTRENRFSDAPAHWIKAHMDRRANVTTRILDLRDFPLPFFDSAMLPGIPGRPAYDNKAVQEWTAAIDASDAFVMATPEYNFAPPAVLKNALDWVYPEWHRKQIGFVSWGSVGGARAVQQLREIAIELQMAPIRHAVHISVEAIFAHFQGNTEQIAAALTAKDEHATALVDDLLWWADALKTARTSAV
ncbi:NADPH-dependent FMN reductase [Burkholderia gladioli]|uniref:NADPH-dependent FMN reductase n=1 Tax=Burkholderia gladioli TaxID=28095 RepID=UPI00163F1D80|nr:NAD(P)H-dependent oxidoreductase [Burkholderia gladioli]